MGGRSLWSEQRYVAQEPITIIIIIIIITITIISIDIVINIITIIIIIIATITINIAMFGRSSATSPRSRACAELFR